MGEVGAGLVTDPRVAKVSLTGSVPTGRRVYASAAAQMKHVTMELGAPLLGVRRCRRRERGRGCDPRNFYSTGQVCSNGTRVFVQRGIRELGASRA